MEKCVKSNIKGKRCRRRVQVGRSFPPFSGHRGFSDRESNDHECVYHVVTCTPRPIDSLASRIAYLSLGLKEANEPGQPYVKMDI